MRAYLPKISSLDRGAPPAIFPNPEMKHHLFLGTGNKLLVAAAEVIGAWFVPLPLRGVCKRTETSKKGKRKQTDEKQSILRPDDGPSRD